MLRFEATDTRGETILLPAPLSVIIRAEEDVPADDLYAVFPDVRTGELCGITVSDSGGLIFKGIIDEQEHICGSTGAFLRLSARSMAALLLDNEALPLCYDHPSAKLIYERHVRDYGIAAGDADDAAYFGELHITKGMSQWGVVRAFCAACSSGLPRVSADGVLYLKGAPAGGRVQFGGSGGIRYTELTDSRRRCEELSRVNVKLSPGDGYGYPVEDHVALARGIRRERYLNAMLGDKSVKDADRMLRQSRQKARVVTLKCVGRYIALLGSRATVADREIGEELAVCAVKYTMDSQGEYTIVKLRRVESCG